MSEKIFISSDHAGVKLKTFLVNHLTKKNIEDLGPLNEDSVDYPDYADLVCTKIHNNSDIFLKGILICGSGQGMVMRANKYPLIRAGLCHTPKAAQLTREHNDANVLCLASRSTFFKTEKDLFDNALKIVNAFLNTEFQSGRHNNRITKLNKPINQI